MDNLYFSFSIFFLLVIIPQKGIQYRESIARSLLRYNMKFSKALIGLKAGKRQGVEREKGLQSWKKRNREGFRQKKEVYSPGVKC